MKTEDLKALGLNEEQVTGVMALKGKAVEAEKATNQTLTQERDGLKAQLSAANEQIAKFKGMDIDGMQKAVDDWKQKAETAETKAKADVEAVRFDLALTTALTGARARNPKSVKALLNMEKLKYSDDGVIGLKDQLDAIKKDASYLFDPEPSGAAGFSGKEPPDAGGKTTNDAMNNALRGAFKGGVT